MRKKTEVKVELFESFDSFDKLCIFSKFSHHISWDFTQWNNMDRMILRLSFLREILKKRKVTVGVNQVYSFDFFEFFSFKL